MNNDTAAQMRRAYDLIKHKQRAAAADILLPIVDQEPDNANAWWLLANARTEPNGVRAALEQFLRLKPGNAKARQMLDELNAKYPPPPPVDDFEFVFDDDAADRFDAPPQRRADGIDQPRARLKTNTVNARRLQQVEVSRPAGGNNNALIILMVIGGLLLCSVVACLAFVAIPAGTVLNQFRQEFEIFSESGTFGERVLRGEIAIGQMANSRVGTSTDDAWTLRGEAGYQLTIEVNATDGRLDPQVYLYDSNGNLLDENDDIGNGNYNSRLIYRLPYSGTYTIVVSAFGMGGDYQLIVR